MPARLVVDPALIVDAEHERYAGGRAIDHLLENNVSSPPFSQATLLPDVVPAALFELGVQFGRVALVAFDDFLEALATDPAMTSIHQSSLAAQTAVETIVAQIRHGVEPPSVLTVPTSLVERSRGCKPAYQGDVRARARASRMVLDRAGGLVCRETFTGRLNRRIST